MAEIHGDYRVVRFDHRGFHLLEAPWRELEQGPDMSAFQSFDWMSLVNERVKKERASRLAVRTRYYLVERAGSPLLIAPFRVHLAPLSPDHRRGIHLVGRDGPADYLNLVYSDFDPQAAEHALVAAAKDYGVSGLRFERMLLGTRAQLWASQLTDARETANEAVRLLLPQSETEYAASLSKSTRQNIRTAWNRARTDGLDLEVTVSSELSQQEAETLALLKRRREANRRTRNLSVVERVRSGLRRIYFGMLFASHDEAQQAMTRAARPWVLRVVADGQICAFAFGLRDNFHGQRTLRILQVGIDDRYARYSPGLLGLHYFISDELTAGRPEWDVIDFTRGGERYKYQLGGTKHAYCDVTTSDFSLSRA